MEKLRVWHMPQVGSSSVVMYIPVDNAKEGKKVMDILAAYDLFQLENNIKPDFCNTSGLQRWSKHDEDWEDWYYEDDEVYCDNVDDYFEQDDNMIEFTKELFGQLRG